MLVFPLYVTGRSKAVPGVWPWVIEQLHYISSHFYVRNAEVVGQILQRERDADPWEVYATLGSYALASQWGRPQPRDAQAYEDLEI